MLTRRRTRRSLVVAGAGLTGTLTGALALAACGQTGTQGGAAESKPAADLKGVTVDYWGMWAPTHPEEVARTAALEHFNTGNQSGIKVNIAASAGQTAANLDKVTGALAAGTPPDMVNTNHFNMSLFAARGATVDIDAELKSNAEWKKARAAAYANKLEGLSWKGKLFAIPSHSSSLLMFWNTNHLRRAGLTPPSRTWTWDQFAEYQKKAAQPPDVGGYDDQWNLRRTGMMAINNGLRLVSQDGTKLQLNTPDFVSVLDYQLGLIKQGLMRAHDGSRSGGYSEKLPDGKVVFQLAVPARVPEYRQKGFTDFGTGYFPVGPKNTAKANYSHGTTYGFTVFKNSNPAKVQAALAAALWQTRADVQPLYTKLGGVRPSYKYVIEDAAFQAEYKKDEQTWPFFEVLPNFLPLPNFPTFPEAEPLIDAQLNAIWAGTVTPREGMEEAQRQAQRLLDQAHQGS